MNKHRPLNLLIISILEISFGLLASFELINLFTYKIRTGNNLGTGGLLFPAVASCSLYLFLGIIVLFKNKIVKNLHLIFVPIITLVLISSAFVVGIKTAKDIFLLLICLSVGFISAIYLSQSK